MNPPPQLALPPPAAAAGGGPQPPGQDHQGRYKPVESFLGSKRDKVIFDVNTQILTREDSYLVETYLKSGGDGGTVDLVQRYLFKMCDSSTMADYLCHIDKMHLEGREVQTVDDILEAFRSTIRERRSLMRIRSDYMTCHLHHTKEPIYG